MLAMINYVVDEEVLRPYVPAGTTLDLFNNKCYVSLVGFMFLNTRVKKIGIPFHRNFEEVNLRFYVKRVVNGETRRGVVFIKEIVPKKAIAYVANTIYKENYVAVPMAYQWQLSLDNYWVGYRFYDQKWHSFTVTALSEGQPLKPGSEEEFIAEHYWGYAGRPDGSTTEYKVEHPPWNVHPVEEFTVDLDYEQVYGEEFAMLNQTKPASAFLADGSEIAVYDGVRLKKGF